MVSRKKAAGKARKAAKAKAREEAEEKERNNQSIKANEIEEALLDVMQQMPCKHGFDLLSLEALKFRGICFQFVTALAKKFGEATRSRGDHALSALIKTARNATMDEYADVWDDSAKMEMVISFFLCSGTQEILDGRHDRARNIAILARYLEQHVAVELKRTHPVANWPKSNDIYYVSDVHTLVKFFRHRIPCSCLDEKYEEVKCITKMGICYNEKCKFPQRRVERSKTSYCSRCRCVVYCSRECQVAHWTQHKTFCDSKAEIIAEFEARQPK